MVSSVRPQVAAPLGSHAGEGRPSIEAYDQLTQPPRDKVNKLLKLNPQYLTWLNGVVTKDHTPVAFVKAATWPDWIKKQTALGYKADGSDNGNRSPPGREASQNTSAGTFYDTPYTPDNSKT